MIRLCDSLFITLVVGLVACAPPSAEQAPEIPDDVKATIRAIVDEGYATGIVVGIINPYGTAYLSYGKASPPFVRPLDENSVFRIASDMKTFTSVLLADMVVRGEVQLDDPIELYLPAGVRAPTRNGHSITLAHLATHTSGLPRQANPPPNAVEEMYGFLSNHTLRRDPGSEFEYSNLGAGLLAHILERRADMTYETLLVERIANELGMSDTRITVTPGMEPRQAAETLAHIQAGITRGRLHSTARDMLTYLAANLGLRETPLYSAMKMTHEPRVAASEGTRVGLAWHIAVVGEPEIVWHTGGGGNFNSFVGFVRGGQTGAVVLMNGLRSGTALSLGTLLLSQPRTAEVDVSVLEGYTGWWEFPSGQGPPIRVDLRDGRLTEGRLHQFAYPAYAESETEFFRWSYYRPFSFVKNEQGEVTALVLHDSDRESNRRATKVGMLNPDAPEIETPRLSPDGRRLVFHAAGQIWLQPLDDGPATRLSELGERGWNPSFSPDGRYLAFARTVEADAELCVFDVEADDGPTACSAGLTSFAPGLASSVTWNMGEPVFSPDGSRVAWGDGDTEVWVLELASGRTRVVANQTDFDEYWLNWSADGRRLILQDHGGSRPNTHRIVAVDVMDGTMTTIIADGLGPTGQGVIDLDGPLRADGQLLYIVAPDAGGTSSLFSLSFDGRAEPELVMAMADFVAERVSADGKWLALTRQDRAGIWLAPLDRGHLEASDIRLVSQEGEAEARFTPDGTALIYVAGNRIWRQPLVGGEREEIPIRIER